MAVDAFQIVGLFEQIAFRVPSCALDQSKAAISRGLFIPMSPATVRFRHEQRHHVGREASKSGASHYREIAHAEEREPAQVVRRLILIERFSGKHAFDAKDDDGERSLIYSQSAANTCSVPPTRRNMRHAIDPRQMDC